MTKFAILWFWEKQQIDESWREIYSFTTSEFERPSVVRSEKRPSSDEVFSSFSPGDNGLNIYVTHDHLPDAPPLWYVYTRNEKAHVPTQTLVAFSTDHFPEGTLVGVSQLKDTGLTPMDRTAAVNWGLFDPKLYQLYVAENMRRRRIGTKLINAADVLHVATGHGGFIYGGDQVTELGKEYGEAWLGSTRRKEPQIIMPPMDR